MGAPVSKPNKFSTSDNLSGTVFGASIGGNETEALANKHARRHTRDESFSSVPKPLVSETETVQMLCAADDDGFDDNDWGDIYKRLKTNKKEDLHILNTRTRFNINNITAFPDDSVSTAGPIFTSTVADRPTRISSANFSPHAIAYERENSTVKTSLYQSAGMMEETNTGEEEGDDFDDSYLAEEKILQPVAESNQHGRCSPNRVKDCENSSLAENTCDKFENVKSDKLKHQLALTEANKLISQDQSCLKIPNDNRGIQSPTPKSHYDSLSGDDGDMDPLDGLEIPRERVYSFGSASIYSVKEISDDLYQKYKAEIKNCIRSYGFFEAHPSPSILREAQKIYRRLDMPSPVDDDGNILPHPPKGTKNKYLAEESNSFDYVREKIENMPESLLFDGQTVDIVHYLCRGLEDDKSKLTILSAWIVVQQTRKPVPNAVKCDTQDDWCRQFRTMCKFARIKSKLIDGIIRRPNYVPGSNLNLYSGHWLAVLVNYTWFLIDPFIYPEIPDDSKKNHAGTASLDGNLFDHVEKMFQDPEDFIFSHYPDEEHWQLLARPVTKAELHELAVLKSGFFTFGMSVINSPKSVMIIRTPEAFISLAFEDKMLQFRCKLRDMDNSLSLARSRTFVFLETNLKDCLVNVRVRFPKKGSFLLEILGSPDDDNWQSVISYKLIYEGDVFSNPFPSNPREEWGPGLETAKIGLTPVLYHSGEILMQRGVIQVAFHNKERLQFEQLLFKDDGNLNPDTMRVSFLTDKNDVIFVVDIDSKITGTFTLQLLARADKNADFNNFCNYLIQKEKAVIIPKLKFNSKNTSIEEKKPIHVPENGKLHLTVDATGFIQLTVELKLHDGQELDFSEHARHWIEDNTGHIDLNFPRKGKYSLQVLGRTVTKGRFLTIKEETIHVDIPSEKWSCFPKEGSNWNSWYKIEAPLSHQLEEKEDITFKVNLKNALDVAVLAANGWYHLDRIGKSWQWTGQVWTGPKSTRCRLLARFDIGSDSWSDLLLFKIVSEEDFEGMEDRQIIAREEAIAESKDVVK